MLSRTESKISEDLNINISKARKDKKSKKRQHEDRQIQQFNDLFLNEQEISPIFEAMDASSKQATSVSGNPTSGSNPSLQVEENIENWLQEHGIFKGSSEEKKQRYYDIKRTSINKYFSERDTFESDMSSPLLANELNVSEQDPSTPPKLQLLSNSAKSKSMRVNQICSGLTLLEVCDPMFKPITTATERKDKLNLTFWSEKNLPEVTQDQPGSRRNSIFDSISSNVQPVALDIELLHKSSMNKPKETATSSNPKAQRY